MGQQNVVLRRLLGELPAGLVVGILGFHCRGLVSVSGWGAEILFCKPRGMAEKKKKKEEKKNITELRENKDEPNIICMWRCN